RAVLMPWPISGFFETIVTIPSGAMETNADRTAGAAAGTADPVAASALAGSRINASNASPPPASREALRSVRLFTFITACSGNMARISFETGSDTDRALNPVVTRTATDIAGHRRVDLLERRLRGP